MSKGKFSTGTNVRELKKRGFHKLAHGTKVHMVKLRPSGVTTLVVGKKDAKVLHRAGPGTVIEQRVYGSDGRLETVYTIDAGSGTFGSDLGYAFKKSVAKARRQNKKKFGTSDVVIQKG